MATAQHPAAPVAAEGAVGPRVGGPAFWFSVALVTVSATAAACTVFAAGALTGPPVSIGSARGTALVVLVVAVPTLIASMIASARGSLRGLIVWLGAVGYLLYNAVLLLIGTPFNNFFLLYVGVLGTSLWSAITILHETDVRALAVHVRGAPAHGAAIYTWVVVGLNALLWLRTIVPAVLSADPTSVIAGTGMTTNPVYIQDLAFWLPLAGVAAWWLWNRRPWGYLIVTSILTMWIIESVSIAVDQWLGHAADPGSSLAGSEMTPVFLALAAIGTVPVVLLLRAIHAERVSDGERIG